MMTFSPLYLVYRRGFFAYTLENHVELQLYQSVSIDSKVWSWESQNEDIQCHGTWNFACDFYTFYWVILVTVILLDDVWVKSLNIEHISWLAEVRSYESPLNRNIMHEMSKRGFYMYSVVHFENTKKKDSWSVLVYYSPAGYISREITSST